MSLFLLILTVYLSPYKYGIKGIILNLLLKHILLTSSLKSDINHEINKLKISLKRKFYLKN